MNKEMEKISKLAYQAQVADKVYTSLISGINNKFWRIMRGCEWNADGIHISKVAKRNWNGRPCNHKDNPEKGLYGNCGPALCPLAKHMNPRKERL